MNLEQARFNMIEQQIRPWGVLESNVLNLLGKIKREAFVPSHLQSLAFADTELPIGYGQTMLSPKLEARLLQAAQPSPLDTVLEIGTGTGFMAALLAHSAANVYSYETVGELADQAKINVHNALFDNVYIQTGCGFAHAKDAAHLHGRQGWNLIMLSGSVPSVDALPHELLDSLAIGGRLIGVFGQAHLSPMMNAYRITKLAQGQLKTEHLFETNAPALAGVSLSQFAF